VELYKRAESDEQKFDAIFTNRLQFTKEIHLEVKVWVAENIDEWRRGEGGGLDWFNIEIIPDDFLPEDVCDEEGGANRRRGSISFVEFVHKSAGSNKMSSKVGVLGIHDKMEVEEL